MKRMRPGSALIATSCSLTVLALAACNGGTQDTPAPNGGQDTVDAALPDVTIPTQEEADARAAQEITPENADEAFEQLQREIESETEE